MKGKPMRDDEIAAALRAISVAMCELTAALMMRAKPEPEPEKPMREAPGWPDGVKRCPHCKTMKFPSDFGTVMRRGIPNLHSWCSKCRATTNYRNLPRKNRTKHFPDVK